MAKGDCIHHHHNTTECRVNWGERGIKKGVTSGAVRMGVREGTR